MAESLPESRQHDLLRKPELASKFPDAVELHHSPVILICGHGGRDMRCGVMAPVLEKQFQEVLEARGIFTSPGTDEGVVDSPDRAYIGLISHIGGHKYAGNVIVYIPNGMKYGDSTVPHPLAGKGIWYGRIEPRHVEGIVEETILNGRVMGIFGRVQSRESVPSRTPLAPGAWKTNLSRPLPFLGSSCYHRHLASTTTPAKPGRLDLRALDKKWQAKWQADGAGGVGLTEGGSSHTQGTREPDGSEKPKFYVLSMFPYPSGTLHMGHLRVYTISDLLARFYRMRGHEVLHPMGWDAFGLPAENAAIERGIDPAKWTMDNIAKMKEQLRKISTSFNWDREIATCNPEFYEHTQRLFLRLYEKDLAYQAEAMVNYDPIDKTVLANEQVDANGFSWRSGARVEKLKLRQWFFRITAFKETLLKDLDSLADGWPERVLSMQRNWLGKSYGAKIKFPLVVEGNGGQHVDIEVFTTRPDTLYGVEYLALALDHPIVLEAAKKDEGLQKFLQEAASFPPDSKAGYKLSNVSVTHPLRAIDPESPHIAPSLPVFVAPYVLSDYGEGAVMGVPGHDSRDFLFFKENANPSSISLVIEAESGSDSAKPITQEGVLNSRCGKYHGLHSREAGKQIVNDLKATGGGDFVEQWRLRDWLISRQRYWGAPIPIITAETAVLSPCQKRTFQ
ncbi:leucyl-tRNA synthetase [Aspergillus ochraceoroseus]|uniref:leucine--tRNA ligase n=1 Tax=Aspergillus ochraceoroseus TaxID=138278 RepID=A0A0F8UED3_9EURO|nr:leucyl-tRNA synthetase [Aspergillus ochraceoroseus]